MFSFFKKNKISINSVSVPDFGGRMEKDDNAMMQWIDSQETIAVSAHFFDLEPDIPTIKDVNVLREFYRDMVISINGGIIEVELIKRQDLDIIRTIFKIPMPTSGMMYVGSLTIPFSTCSYVLKVQAVEAGPTGMRETIVADKLLQAGTMDFDSWSTDPYNKEYKSGLLMNKAEDQAYDAEFPAHPLSQVRHLLNQLENGFQIDKAVKKCKPFSL